MAGPWENYQAPGAAQPASGPWLRYQSPAGTPGGYTPATDPADTFRAPEQPQATIGRAPLNGQATPSPTDMWTWWNQAHGNDRQPTDPRDVLNRWAREAPEQFQAYNDWYQQNYGAPFAVDLNSGYHALAWGAGPRYDFNEQAGNPMPPVDMAVHTFAQGASLGTADNILRLLGRDQAANIQEQAVQGFHLQHPEAAGTIELAGGALPFMIPGGIARAAGAGARGVTAAEAAGGALGGVAAGYGYSDPNAPISERLGAMAVAGVLGGIGGRLGAEAGTVRPLAREGEDIGAPVLYPRNTEAATYPRPNKMPPEANAADTFRAPGVRVRTDEDLLNARDAYGAEASAFYDAAKQAGIAVSTDSYIGALRGIGTTLAREGPISETLHPQTVGVLQNLARRAQEGSNLGLDLSSIELARQEINHALQIASPADAHFLNIVKKEFDRYLNGLSGADVVATNSTIPVEQATAYLRQARQIWSAKEQLNLLAEAAIRATNAAATSSISFERALQQQLKIMDNNPAIRSRFSPAAQEALRTAVRGGPAQKIANIIYAAAPRGFANTALTFGGALFGQPQLAIPGILGGGASLFRNLATRSNVNNLYSAITSGPAPSLVPVAPSAWQAIGGGVGASTGQGLFGFPAP